MPHDSLPPLPPQFFDRIGETHRGFRLRMDRIRDRSATERALAEPHLRELVRDLRAHSVAIEGTLGDSLLVEALEGEIHDEVLRERELRETVDRLGESVAALPDGDPRWKAKMLAFADGLEVLLDVSDRHLDRWRRDLGPEETRALGLRYDHRLDRSASTGADAAS
jgi:hypothetical protein